MQYMATLTKEGKRTLIEFPDCPGCQTFADPGEDVEELAREALEGWLELHLEDGEAPPRPVAKEGKSRVAIRIDPMLAVRLLVRWARQDSGLSQGELAKRLGVSRQQVSLLESAGSNVTMQTLQNVATALGQELDIALIPRRKVQLA